MALYFHPLYENYFLGALMWVSVEGAGQNSSNQTATLTQLKALTIYSGTQPSATDFESNFNTTYRNTHLLHFTDATWAPLFSGSVGSAELTQYYISLLPSAATASASGTASWAILWSYNSSMTSINSGIGSSFYTGDNTTLGRYIILPVSDNSGNGMIKLSSTNITSGNSYTVQSGSFNITVSPIV